MTEIDNKYKQDSSSPMNAVYSYSEQYIKNKLEMYHKLEARIFGMLTFSGVVLKIAADLPTIPQKNGIDPHIPSASLVAKILMLLLIVMSIMILITNVKFSLAGSTVSLKDIKKAEEEVFGSSEERFKKTIFLKWINLEKEVENGVNRRGNAINNALISLSIAGFLYVCNISTTAILSYLHLI